MTRRAATIQGLLALAGLFAAYLTWQRDPSLEGGQAFVLDITKNDLTTIRYEELDRVTKTKPDSAGGANGDNKQAAKDEVEETVRTWVELSSTKGPAGPTVWVRLSGKEAPNVELPSGHPVVQVALPERQLRGNESAEKMWEAFAPWRASRALGVLNAETLKELGLSEPKKRLKVTFKGVTKSFSVAPAPPGGTDPYVRDDEDGRVYIVARQILTDFQAAKSNITERRLHNFLLQDVDKIVLSSKGKKKEFVFRPFDARPGGELFAAETPDRPDQTATNWHDRVFALFPSEVLGKDEKPVGGPPQEAVRVEYYYRGKQIGFTELSRAGTADGPEAAAGTPRAEALARSEFTAGWVTLSAEAQNLLSEGESLFGGS